MLRYKTDQAPQRWTRTDLMGVAGFIVVLFCIWAIFEMKGCSADENRSLLVRTRAQLAEAKKKNDSLTERLKDTQKQLDEANDRVMALNLVAARAPPLPVRIKSWRDTSTTQAIALENQSDRDLSVHLSVTNPNRSRPREQDCFVPAHKTVGTSFRIYPNDIAVVTADGFATKTQRMD
jgi:hypothetical protein